MPAPRPYETDDETGGWDEHGWGEPWERLTDIELDPATWNLPRPRRRGRPERWDEEEARRVRADALRIRNVLLSGKHRYTRKRGEPEPAHQARLTAAVLEFYAWLQEAWLLGYRAKPDPDDRPVPGEISLGRGLQLVLPDLTEKDAAKIARRSEGNIAALTLEFLAHIYEVSPDSIRGALDKTSARVRQ